MNFQNRFRCLALLALCLGCAQMVFAQGTDLGTIRGLVTDPSGAVIPNAKVSIEPFIEIIGRHFKQPKEGLGNDNSSVAHMWRTMANPDQPL